MAMSREAMVKIAEAAVQASRVGKPLQGDGPGKRPLIMEQIRETLEANPGIARVVLEAIRDHGPTNTATAAQSD